jgi:hypothetical protein
MPTRSALALLLLVVPSLAAAQTTVHVDVDVHVTTPPPTPGVVIVEQPPPVVIVVAQPQPPPVVVVEPPPPVVVETAAVEQRRGVVPVLHGRGVFALADEMEPLLGGAVGLGLRFDPSWTGSIVVQYLSSFDDRSEIDLGIEIARDFSPGDPLGFVILAGLGAAFGLEPVESMRGMAQAGIGARASIGAVDLTADMRGLLRFDAGDLDGPEVSAGFAISAGLNVAL